MLIGLEITAIELALIGLVFYAIYAVVKPLISFGFIILAVYFAYHCYRLLYNCEVC